MTSIFPMTRMAASTGMCTKGALWVCAEGPPQPARATGLAPSGRSHGLHRLPHSPTPSEAQNRSSMPAPRAGSCSIHQ